MLAIAAIIVGNSADAEDVVQDAMLAAWRGWDRIRDPARRDAWLTPICVRESVNHGKKLRLRWLQERAIDVGAEPGSPALNPATDTLYVPFGTSADRIAVINAATCNAEAVTGCGQRPAVIDVGEGTFALGVSATTDTIYAPSGGLTGAPANTVAIISGVACNSTDHSGCGHVAATVLVGRDPYGVAVSDATETVYVANDADGEAPGTLSMINESTCNGSFTSGCGGAMTTIGIGRSPNLIVVDGTADFVYVTDHASAEVSELNGATCNAADTSGCNAAIEQAVGSQPFGLAVNPDTNTVYAMTFLGAASISVFAGGALE